MVSHGSHGLRVAPPPPPPPRPPPVAPRPPRASRAAPPPPAPPPPPPSPWPSHCSPTLHDPPHRSPDARGYPSHYLGVPPSIRSFTWLTTSLPRRLWSSSAMHVLCR